MRTAASSRARHKAQTPAARTAPSGSTARPPERSGVDGGGGARGAHHTSTRAPAPAPPPTRTPRPAVRPAAPSAEQAREEAACWRVLFVGDGIDRPVHANLSPAGRQLLQMQALSVDDERPTRCGEAIMPSSKLSISSTPVTDRRDRASSVILCGASSAFCSGILVIALLPSSRIGNIYERVGRTMPDYFSFSGKAMKQLSCVFGERFCSKAKFEGRRHPLWISSPSNCGIGAKDPPKTADR